MDLQKVNWVIKNVVRRLLKYYFEIKAAFGRKVFTCGVLNGTSTYNLAVNSDMTVSCNCQDFDGSGKLGDLTEKSLKMIMGDKNAR